MKSLYSSCFQTHTSRPRLSSDVAYVQTWNVAGFLATYAVVVHVISQVRLRQLRSSSPTKPTSRPNSSSCVITTSWKFFCSRRYLMICTIE